MINLEIGQIYMLAVAIGQSAPFDIITGILDHAENGLGYLLEKPFIVDAKKNTNTDQIIVKMISVVKANPMMKNDRIILMRSAIHMAYTPADRELEQYRAERSGIIQTNQMPPKDLHPKFVDQLLKRGE
jgi:hypothetical protein